MPSPFDEFLSWLSPDRDEAAQRYENLRRKLVKHLIWGGCHIPDELADEIMDRASRNLAEGKVHRSVDPNGYCFGVAKFVLHEYWRDGVMHPGPLDETGSFLDAQPDPIEREAECLDECLERLNKHDRDLVTFYYQYTGSAKIKVHKQMADQEGGMNVLRLRIHRIKNGLRDCVFSCLQRHDKSM